MSGTFPSWKQLCDQGIRQGPFFRSLGQGGNGELVGVGFMNKKTSAFDHHHYDPSYYSLSYLVSGEGSYENHVDGTVVDLKAGSYFQRIPGVPHSTYIKNEPEWIECFISLGPHLCKSLEHCGWIQPQHPCGFLGLSNTWINAFIDINLRSFEIPESRVKEFQLDCLTLLEKIFSSSNSKMDRGEEEMIQRACIILSRSFSEGIDLVQLCKENQWNYDHFRKHFKKEIGISPAQYRIHRRIDEAKRLLILNTKLKLADCAEALGYSSVYEFCAQFKKMTGTSPGRFRAGNK